MRGAYLFFVGLAICSFPAISKVSFEQKAARFADLKAALGNTNFALDAYARELKYEELNLKKDERASLEAMILSENINQQVHKSYNKSYEELGNAEAAYKAVSEAIVQDIKNADPSIQAELQDVAFEALENARSDAGISFDKKLDKVEKFMEAKVTERMDYLNSDDSNTNNNFECCDSNPIQPTVNPSKDAERKNFNNINELVESITSSRDNARWVAKASTEVKVAEVVKQENSIKIQVRINFLGAEVEAGPSISFKREINTTALLMAEGMHPAVKSDGTFDFFQRDQAGRILKKNGKEQKRFLSFSCYADKIFSTEYAGGGTFSVGTSSILPVGVNVSSHHSSTKAYQNSVEITSRRVVVPETVGGQYFTIKNLADLCHRHFLSAKLQSNLTVEQSLDISMRNLVSGLVYNHNKTQCAKDEQCYDWYNNKVAGLFKIKNWPRCRQVSDSELFFGCKLLGQVGQNCPVVEKVTRTKDGKKTTSWERTSDGQFEFECDIGLKCQKYQNVIFSKSFEKYLRGDKKQYAKGKCAPVNPRTYKSPIQLQNEREYQDSKFVDIEIQ